MVHKCCVTNFNGNFNTENKVQRLKAVAQRCSVKKVFLEISQNSQENTCARVSFLIKLQPILLGLLRVPLLRLFLGSHRMLNGV